MVESMRIVAPLRTGVALQIKEFADRVGASCRIHHLESEAIGGQAAVHLARIVARLVASSCCSEPSPLRVAACRGCSG